MNKLGDHIEYVKGFAFKSKDYTETGIPVIRVSNFTDNSIDIKDVYHIPKERFSEFQKVSLIKDDIVIATVGSWPTNPSSVVGKTIRVPPEANNTLLNQNAVRIRSLDKDEQLYFYYVLKDKSFSDYIISTAQGSANQASITLKSILDYDLPNIDSKEKRIKIGKTLATYDEKIQLNTQINQTLEKIAQALFKSWFVDFDPVRAKVQALSDGLSLEQAELAAMQVISGKTPEELTALSQIQPDRYAELVEIAKAFPCEMVEVDGVEVPKGWELSTIGDCYDVIMGQSPKGETYNENKQGMLFYQGRAEFGWRFPTPRLFTTDPKRIAEQNSILMSVRAPVGDINIALEKCCIGRGLATLQHKSKSLSFGLYQIQSIKPELDLFNGEGTVFGSINQANLKNIQIINPDEKFIQLFEKYLSSCDSKIMNNEIENNELKEIRDLLLPRLLSGNFND